jgi:hypothetical protein
MRARCSPVLIALLATATSAAAAEEFRPRFDQATLKMDEQEFPRMRIASPWHSQVCIDGMCYRVDGDTVIQSERDTGKVIRRAHAPDGAKLRWNGAARGIAYLTETVARRNDIQKNPLAVRRLDLNRMKWQLPLEIVPIPPADDPALNAREAAAVERLDALKMNVNANSDVQVAKPERGAGVCDVLVTDAGAAILTYLDIGNDRSPWWSTLGFQLALVPPDSDKQRWSQWVSYPEDPQEKSPLSLSPSIAFADESPPVSRLTGIKNGVVVCLPWTQELLCFNEIGEQTWRLPRIWEFERWNMGPTSGFWGIDPFGAEVEEGVTAGIPEGLDPKDAEEQQKAAQEKIDNMLRDQRAFRAGRSEKFYRDYKAWIASGPVKVPPADDERDEERLMFAVGKARIPTNAHAPPASECVIYQVSAESGGVEAMTSIPRLVYPRPHVGSRGASIWTCEGGSIARIGIGDSDDLQCPVEWYRAYPGLVDSSWDEGASTSVSCLTSNRLFRTGFEYHIPDGEKALTFQINVVDIATGLARDMTLVIPFEGKVPKHEEGPAGDPSCTQMFGRPAFRIAIERLEIDGHALIVVVRTGKLQTGIDFDIQAILRKPEPEQL